MKRNFQIFFILILLNISGFSSVFSQQRTVDQVSTHSFVAGPTSAEIDLQAAEKECLNWSWAACLQAVFKFYGLEISQDQIVKKLFKGAPCTIPNSYAVLNGVSGWAPDSGKKFSTVYSQGGVWTNDKIIACLAGRAPMIVTLQNAQGKRQVYILISIYYTEDGGMKVPDKVMIIEPVANADPFIVLPWDKYVSGKPELFKFWVIKKTITPKK
jgi:hypothetical protein